MRALAFCLGLLAAAGVWPAGAQDLSRIEIPPQVLVIDQERLFEESDFGLELAARIEERARELAMENRRIEAELVEEERELTELRATLSVDEFRQMADRFDEKVQGIRVVQDQKSRDLAREREQGRQSFFNQLAPILSEILRERNALLLVDRRAVLLSADLIDITDTTIERFNERFGGALPPVDDTQ